MLLPSCNKGGNRSSERWGAVPRVTGPGLRLLSPVEHLPRGHQGPSLCRLPWSLLCHLSAV